MILGTVSFLCFILGFVLCSYATDNDIPIMVALGLMLLFIGFLGLFVFIATNLDIIIKCFKI